jgi:hypothetical protein
VKPRARSGLILRAVGNELIVYDSQTHVAHCLNRTAALVFQAADGRENIEALSARLGRQAEIEVPQEVVAAALDELADAGLLEAPVPGLDGVAGHWSPPPSRPAEPSRRSAMRAFGVAALAPIVASLVVPTPAEAANTCIPQASCTAANFGQPCYVAAQAECASKICTGTPGQCQ